MRSARNETAVDGSQATTYYLYEGTEIVYKETWASGSRTESAFNLYLGGVNVGRYIQKGGVESLQYFYNDHLGSRRAVLSSTGTILAKLDYSVWGISTVTGFNGYDGTGDVSYTGKERDASKLYYFNARYYDASIGRFITEDPVRDDMNWFAYCGNNPLSCIDPTGLQVVYIPVPRRESSRSSIGLVMPGQPRSFDKALARSLDNATASLIKGVVDFANSIPEVKKIRDLIGSNGKEAQDRALGKGETKAAAGSLKGKPGSSVITEYDEHGKPKQVRVFGEDGYADTDWDLVGHNGEPPTHTHHYGRPEDGGPPTNDDRGEAQEASPDDVPWPDVEDE